MTTPPHSSSLLLLLLLLLALAGGSAARWQPEPKPHAPNGWVRGPLAHSSATLDVHLALVRDTTGWEEQLLALSDPLSPRYGQHLTHAQVVTMATPSARCVRMARRWIGPHAQHVSLAGHGDWLFAGGVRVDALSRLLQTDFHTWTHPHRRTTLIRAQRYSLPTWLRECVELVSGVKRMPPKRLTRTPVQRPSKNMVVGFSPQDMRTVWNVGSVVGNATNSNIQACHEFGDGDNYSPSDLTEYQKGWKVPVQSVWKQIGPNDPSNPSIEADMDVQLLISVNQGTKTMVTNNPADSFLTWLIMMANITENYPLVSSISYGEDADTVDHSHMLRVGQEFVKMSSMGVSFLFATGDYGVNCVSDGPFPNGTTHYIQVPTFPSVSPWVTAVGGANWDKSTGSITGDNITGSGFSNDFAMPLWGRQTWQTYVAKHTPPPGHSYFNVTGRAYPDIVALSENIEFVWQYYWSFTGGTSCAAPAASALISLLNDVRLAANKSTLGFLNPLLYHWGTTNPSVFFDITQGSRNSQGNCEGFAAAPGWDALTGWGGINFAEMRKAVLALP